MHIDPRPAARSLLLSALFTVLVCSAGNATAADVPTLSQQALLERLANKDPSLTVLDVRTPAEFAAGHVPGAINLPHDQIETRIAELNAARSHDVVAYCGTGRRAGMALDTLQRLGFTRLAHLEGDWTAWAAAGLAAERSSTAPPPASPAAAPVPSSPSASSPTAKPAAGPAPAAGSSGSAPSPPQR